jgi:hypothetical protein
MLEFMRAGGYAMWVILLLGGLALWVAGSFAWRPGERKLGILRPLSVATVFATLAGIFSGFGATMHNVTTNPEWSQSPELHLIVMTGIGESLANAILGFGMLTVAWILATVGMRRMA